MCTIDIGSRISKRLKSFIRSFHCSLNKNLSNTVVIRSLFRQLFKKTFPKLFFSFFSFRHNSVILLSCHWAPNGLMRPLPPHKVKLDWKSIRFPFPFSVSFPPGCSIDSHAEFIATYEFTSIWLIKNRFENKTFFCFFRGRFKAIIRQFKT